MSGLNIVHLAGSTIKVENEIRNYPAFGETQGALMDPDSHTIKIYDPEGTDKTDTVVEASESVGQWYFYYTIPTDGIQGTWVCIWEAVKGTYKGKKKISFEVEVALS